MKEKKYRSIGECILDWWKVSAVFASSSRSREVGLRQRQKQRARYAKSSLVCCREELWARVGIKDIINGARAGLTDILTSGRECPTINTRGRVDAFE